MSAGAFEVGWVSRVGQNSMDRHAFTALGMVWKVSHLW
jgi:hypothetical protein